MRIALIGSRQLERKEEYFKDIKLCHNVCMRLAHTQLFAIVSIRPFIVHVTVQIQRFIIRVPLTHVAVQSPLANGL